MSNGGWHRVAIIASIAGVAGPWIYEFYQYETQAKMAKSVSFGFGELCLRAAKSNTNDALHCLDTELKMRNALMVGADFNVTSAALRVVLLAWLVVLAVPLGRGLLRRITGRFRGNSN